MMKFSIVLTLALAVLASRLAVELKRLGALPIEHQANHSVIISYPAAASVSSNISLTSKQ